VITWKVIPGHRVSLFAEVPIHAGATLHLFVFEHLAKERAPYGHLKPFGWHLTTSGHGCGGLKLFEGHEDTVEEAKTAVRGGLCQLVRLIETALIGGVE